MKFFMKYMCKLNMPNMSIAILKKWFSELNKDIIIHKLSGSLACIEKNQKAKVAVL